MADRIRSRARSRFSGYDCYDVVDTTGDQLYRPEKLENGVWEVK